MNVAVGHMDGSALMVIGVSAWYPDSLNILICWVEEKIYVTFQLNTCENEKKSR